MKGLGVGFIVGSLPVIVLWLGGAVVSPPYGNMILAWAGVVILLTNK